MKSTRSTSTAWMLGRALLPSGASGAACILGSVAFVGLGVVLASVNYGTVLPNIFDGQFATFYTNSVVQPLETLIHNNNFSTAVAMVGWGILGVAMYSVVEIGLRTYQSWRSAQRDVQFINERTIVMHPLEKSFIVHAVWRLGVSIVSFLFAVAVQPLTSRSFADMRRLVVASNARIAVHQLAFCLLVWLGIMHVCVVLLRLYLLRTRLFGDAQLEATQR